MKYRLLPKCIKTIARFKIMAPLNKKNRSSNKVNKSVKNQFIKMKMFRYTKIHNIKMNRNKNPTHKKNK